MRNNNCEIIRRELDESMLDESCSTPVIAHLKECSACREFHRTQTRLRQIVGSLGTIDAPADFDFRLRARLANDASHGAFRYRPLLQRGLAVAAVLIVFAFGVVVVRNLLSQQPEVVVENLPVRQQPPAQTEPVSPNDSAQAGQLAAQVPTIPTGSGPDRIRSERTTSKPPRANRTLTTMDFSKQGAEVISASEAFAVESGAVFPVDASLQPLRLSLDDGSGNARTISVPTIRFGSQRMLPNRNQLAEKGIW